MNNLKNKSHMDEEVEGIIDQVRYKVQRIHDLFMRNRGEGSTEAIKPSMIHSDSPLLLSGSVETGKHIIADVERRTGKDIKAENISWRSIDGRNIGTSGHEIVVDNSFMIRMLDSVNSVIQFLYGEIERLRTQNNNLREANRNLASTNREMNQRLKSLEKKQKKLKKKTKELKQQVKATTNGQYE